MWRDDVPVAQIDYVPSRRVIYLEADQNNTPRVGRDQSGAIIWQWNSDAFGTTKPTASTGVTVNLRFPGQYFDIESGLDYNLFRDYDAGSGRYSQSDPIGLAGGVNTYTYVNGNPISLVDPLGLAAVLETPTPIGPMPLPVPSQTTPAPSGGSGSTGNPDLDRILSPSLPRPVNPWGPDVHTEQRVPSPIPPLPPKKPGTGCTDLYEACMKGMNACGIPRIGKAACLTLYLMCEANKHGGNDGAP